MKPNSQWMIVGLILAVVLSGASLAMQIKRETTRSKFEQYRNTGVSDLQRRWIETDIAAIRERWESRDGVFVPYVRGFTPDGKKLLIRVNVFPSDLPKSVDERKSVLMFHGVFPAETGFAAGFGDSHDLNFDRDVVVEFVNFGPLLKGEKKPETIAVYENGQLTFH